MVEGDSELEKLSMAEEIDIIEILGNCIDDSIREGRSNPQKGFEIFYPKKLNPAEIKYIVDYFKNERKFNDCRNLGEAEKDGIKGYKFDIIF